MDCYLLHTRKAKNRDSSNRKNLWSHGVEAEKGSLGSKHSASVFDTPFGAKKAPYFCTEIGHLHAKMLQK